MTSRRETDDEGHAKTLIYEIRDTEAGHAKYSKPEWDLPGGFQSEL